MHGQVVHQLPPLQPHGTLSDVFATAAARKALSTSTTATPLFDHLALGADDYAAAEILLDAREAPVSTKRKGSIRTAPSSNLGSTAGSSSGSAGAGTSRGPSYEDLSDDGMPAGLLRPFSYVSSRASASADRRSQYDYDHDDGDAIEDALDEDDVDDEDSFLDDEPAQSSRLRSLSSAGGVDASPSASPASFTTSSAGRRRSFVPPTPTAHPTIATPGLAGDDLPGAKARKVLGLDSEGWEIGPGSSDADASGSHGRSSTSRKATARVTALLHGGGGSSHSSSGGGSLSTTAAIAEGLHGNQHSPVTGAPSSSSSSSRRHSLLPAMLSLARRPSVAQHAQPHTNAADTQPSPLGTTPQSGLTGSAGGPTGSLSATSTYLPATPTTATSLHAPGSLSSGLGTYSASPRPMHETATFHSPSHLPSSSSASMLSSSSSKGLRKGRSRKRPSTSTASNATPTYSFVDEASTVGSSRGVAPVVSLADAQDWERALEMAERNASWYSSIAHRPRPRPGPGNGPGPGPGPSPGQASGSSYKMVGTPVPRAGSTSSASSTPTTDQSHHSLFHSSGQAGASGMGSGAGGAGRSSAQSQFGLGLGADLGPGSVRRSASTSNLVAQGIKSSSSSSASASGLKTGWYAASSTHSSQTGEQEEELLDEASLSGPESGGAGTNGGAPTSVFSHLHAYVPIGSPIRPQSAAGFSSSHRRPGSAGSGEAIGLRSPIIGPVMGGGAAAGGGGAMGGAGTGPRYSPVTSTNSNTVPSPEPFRLSSGSGTSFSAHRLSRYSFVSNGGGGGGGSGGGGTTSGISSTSSTPPTTSYLAARPRRPSHDPHPLPPSLISGAPLDWNSTQRRPSLGNEVLSSSSTSVPAGWKRDDWAKVERARSGSFGSAVVFRPGGGGGAGGGVFGERRGTVPAVGGGHPAGSSGGPVPWTGTVTAGGSGSGGGGGGGGGGGNRFSIMMATSSPAPRPYATVRATSLSTWTSSPETGTTPAPAPTLSVSPLSEPLRAEALRRAGLTAAASINSAASPMVTTPVSMTPVQMRSPSDNMSTPTAAGARSAGTALMVALTPGRDRASSKAAEDHDEKEERLRRRASSSDTTDVEGVIPLQLDKRVQDRLVGSVERKPRDSCEVSQPGDGRAVENVPRTRPSSGPDSTSTSTPGHIDSGVPTSRPDGSLSRTSVATAAAADEAMSSASVVSLPLLSPKTAAAYADQASSHDTVQAGSADSGSAARSAQRISLASSVGAEMAGVEGEDEDGGFYREMYARGLPSDLPRPVSVYSDSHDETGGEEEEEDGEWEDVDGEE